MTAIEGKAVAITGAARGIGFAIARALLDKGATVVIGDRDLNVLDSAVTALAGFGRVTAYPLDVADPASFSQFIEKAVDDGDGRLDVLVNNAGVMPIGPYLEQSDQSIRAAIEVNFFGVLTGCRLVLPHMLAQCGGHIVNIASLAGAVPVPGEVVYAGTKAAVVALSTALADEFAAEGVQVSVVLPSFTATDLIWGTTTPSGGKVVAPEAVAKAVVKVIERPKTHVVVPHSMRFIAPLMSMMGPRNRRWINARVGSDHAFLVVDRNARQAYEARVEAALDPVECRHPDTGWKDTTSRPPVTAQGNLSENSDG